MYLVGLPCSDSFVDYSRNVTPDVDRKLVTCRQLNMAPGPPIDFGQERNRTGGCQKLLPSSGMLRYGKGVRKMGGRCPGSVGIV